MSDWKAMVSRPMTERKLYELLGVMLKAKVKWAEAELAFQEMLDNDPRYKKGHVGEADKDLHMMELRMRFSYWLDKGDEPKKKA
jgi:hypothetical protein